jgi:hypothetical protein
MEPFRKVINPGKVNVGLVNPAPVFCSIKWDGERLSISGVVGPTRNGNCSGGCGQILGDLLQLVSITDGWSYAMVHKLHELWDRWHLNDLRAGTPTQEAHLRSLKVGGAEPWLNFTSKGYPNGGDHYAWAKHVLAEAGLQPDNSVWGGYSYGSQWLTEEVPEEVLAYLAALPDTTVTPAWV